MFILAIVVVSVISRLWRQTELRVGKVTLDATAQRFIREAAEGEIRIIAHDTDQLSLAEYEKKEEQTRRCNHVPLEHPILFLEITVPDASEFAPDLAVWGVQVGPYCVLRAQSAAVPNAIAAFLLYIRDTDGQGAARLLRVERGQPVRPPGALRPGGRGRHRAGLPRGAAPGRAGADAPPDGPRRLTARFE